MLYPEYNIIEEMVILHATIIQYESDSNKTRYWCWL